MKKSDYAMGMLAMVLLIAFVLNSCNTPAPAITPMMQLPPISDNIGWMKQ